MSAGCSPPFLPWSEQLPLTGAYPTCHPNNFLRISPASWSWLLFLFLSILHWNIFLMISILIRQREGGGYKKEKKKCRRWSRQQTLQGIWGHCCEEVGWNESISKKSWMLFHIPPPSSIPVPHQLNSCPQEKVQGNILEDEIMTMVLDLFTLSPPGNNPSFEVC